jgi:hypothetical protein
VKDWLYVTATLLIGMAILITTAQAFIGFLTTP